MSNTEQQFLKSIDDKRWKAADKLRVNLNVAKYKHGILRLIFLKYVLHAIQSLNSAIRRTIKCRKVFPSDDGAMRVVLLAMQQALKGRTTLTRSWEPALIRFSIEFEDRLDGRP
ncbi:MAG: type I restriction-modification system subunit M N-terminal domain-containing protein [Halieaceae bacterium]|uniref:type I restriction-modification system subunit M N-terminal domain-containing protein n=1 Tax=Haliea alexandrii TaxID=2448162 RepID=UPI00130485A8|nr:type I restriction-modification system subunit M N-terminal domain-containing protein [Haliea alexandrii]MCR9186628.1 type I restriction-modification system subunit M N-terminal domain-containing protein [Halieaceae bacterium]